MRRGCQIVLLKQAHTEWSAAGYGERTAVLARYSETLGVGPRQIRALFVRHGLAGGKPKRTRQEARRYPHWQAWSEVVGAVKHSPPIDEGPMPTEIAVRTSAQSGLIPAEAEGVPVRTWDRWLTELGVHCAESRARRLRAGEPNQAWYADASRSKHFKVIRALSDGDYELEFQDRREGPYANKPEREMRLRVWVYAVVDDNSSMALARLAIAGGENALDFLRFLDWAMARPADNLILRGRPLNLVLDNGPVKVSLKGDDAFQRCGIGLPPRAPYNKRAGGRVERTFRTMWSRFEKSFYGRVRALRNEGGGKLRLKLSELNEALGNYLIEYQHRPHPTFAEMSRAQAWLRIAHTGLVEIAPGAIFHGYKQAKKKLDDAGWFRHKGRAWEVEGLHGCEVYIYEDLEGNLFARDSKGYGRRVIPAVEAEFGEYRGQRKSRRDELVAGLSGEIASIYSGAPAVPNVVAMPPRVARTVEAELPFAAPGTYRTVEEALSALVDAVGVERWRQFDEEAIGALRAHLEGELTESAVRELARDLRAAIATA